jgi:hypothetical protein
MSTSTTTKMAGTTLPQLKSGVPLPPVDLDSEEVLGGEESDEALSSDVRVRGPLVVGCS